MFDLPQGGVLPPCLPRCKSGQNAGTVLRPHLRKHEWAGHIRISWKADVLRTQQIRRRFFGQYADYRLCADRRWNPHFSVPGGLFPTNLSSCHRGDMPKLRSAFAPYRKPAHGGRILRHRPGGVRDRCDRPCGQSAGQPAKRKHQRSAAHGAACVLLPPSHQRRCVSRSRA